MELLLRAVDTRGKTRFHAVRASKQGLRPRRFFKRAIGTKRVPTVSVIDKAEANAGGSCKASNVILKFNGLRQHHQEYWQVKYAQQHIEQIIVRKADPAPMLGFNQAFHSAGRTLAGIENHAYDPKGAAPARLTDFSSLLRLAAILCRPMAPHSNSNKICGQNPAQRAFTNNKAETDLRMGKSQAKVSGVSASVKGGREFSAAYATVTCTARSRAGLSIEHA